MEVFLKRVENLLTVKSIVTLALTAVFACQAARGEEVCYLYYLESGIVRLWFPDKEIQKFKLKVG